VPNRLAQQKSLYLLQHQDNPVDWWPWCPEAFATARAQDKPVLVSVGYSSCHWCHVMAQESFSQPWIADLMNQHFVCIKVDREELPEVDQLMMSAVQMVSGQGGWPLNCFCLPDGRPFFGGVYFPPEDRGLGQVPWPQLLMRVSDFYHRNKKEFISNAEAITQNLTHLTRPPEADGQGSSPDDLIAAGEKICAQHDDSFGGFGGAPKFPSPSTLQFLLTLRGSAAVEAKRELATRLDAVLTMTLGAMARGGLYDQIGGGFHRYCVDRDWTVPHFEKMLYDNAQLIGTYAAAWARYRDPLYAQVVAETIGWLQREMQLSQGLFAASLDADTQHHEGTTYIWKSAEIAEALGSQAFDFAQVYGISDQGNFEGANIPKLRGKFADRERLAAARQQLLEIRNRRPQPTRDEKALLSWNALLIRHLAEAAWIFGRHDWFELALKTEKILSEKIGLSLNDASSLKPVVHGSIASGEATLLDYAWLAEAELSLSAYALWAHTSPTPYLEKAKKLLEHVHFTFRDDQEDGFFLVGPQRTNLAVRQKDWFDHATPSSNSALLNAFGKIQALQEQPLWRHEFAQLSQAYGGLSRRLPDAIGYALHGLTQYAIGYATLKAAPGAFTDTLQQVLLGDAHTPPHQRPYRPLWLIAHEPATGYQVCVGETCLAPVNQASDLSFIL